MLLQNLYKKKLFKVAMRLPRRQKPQPPRFPASIFGFFFTFYLNVFFFKRKHTAMSFRQLGAAYNLKL
jgi:hypothetical protein